jgi:hypothetical protein
LPFAEPHTEFAVIPKQKFWLPRPQQLLLGVHAEALPAYAVHAACACAWL